MARQIAPGNPMTPEAKLVKVDMPDFSMLDDMGDAQIKASNTNFKLYAENIVNTESAKAYDQFKTNPIQLSNALGKIPEMLDGLPEEIQNQMKAKLYLNSVSLVQKARDNELLVQDQENKVNSDKSAIQSKVLMAQTYQSILQNHIAKAEDKNKVANDVFLEQQMNLNNIADLTNSQGKLVYSESQRKAMRNVDDLELEGFKQFFDSMLINDNDKLEQSKDYYTKFILAPERFMAENYMNRATYDKARTYAEKELKRAGADIKAAKFNQSVKEATELQIADLPGRLESLKESGQLSDDLIGKIEKMNVKFNEIDPSKAETPTAMLDLLNIINESGRNSAPRTEAEQQKILEQGTAALDAIADYAQTYGLSPEKARQAREMVVNWETNAAFAPVLRNFGNIIDGFESKLATVRAESTGKKKGKYITQWDNLSDEEQIQLIRLNNLLAISTDKINQQIRQGDWEGVRQTQRDVQKGAAQIRYSDFNWASVEQNPDEPVYYHGRMVKFKNYTLDGDVVFEILK